MNLLNQIITLGELPTLSVLEKRKLHLINATCLLGLVLILAYAIYFLSIGLYIALPIDIIGLFCFSVPIFCNWRGALWVGKLIFVLSNYIFFGLMCVMYGKSSGMEYSFVMGIIIPQFLFDKKRVSFIFCLLSFTFFSFFSFFYFPKYKGLAENFITKETYFFNMASLFAVIYLIIKQFKYENETYQALVLQQNEELTHQKEEIETQRDLIEIEKQKSEQLLLNILPEETAQELKEKGFATPKHYELITVLFTDFKGFTSIAEKMTPHEVIENLNTCFYELDLICDKYGLEKIKTIGDSYMCAGGLPIANTTNPVDVVKAGLEMQAFMEKWAKGKREKGEQAWELRLGIHSGEAIAGVVGKNKFAYDIWGDTVNLASRMESSGEVGKVNISEATYNLVKDSFICVQRGAVMAKNKGEMQMYFVERIL